jgi:hypothetical protein
LKQNLEPPTLLPALIESEKQMRISLAQILKSVTKWLNFFGIRYNRLLLLRHVPTYLRHLRSFKKQGGKVTHTWPILDDFGDKAGSASGHYFHQDLLVASLIFRRNPARHIDVGSRIDGFVAHVASFRNIEVADVRPLISTGHDSITFTILDLMDSTAIKEDITDSISSLHVLEHVGLGRYGDTPNPNGHKIAFNNLLRMVSTGGAIYISFPIGRDSQVHFNAHRVFRVDELFEWAEIGNAFRLVRFDFIDDNGDLHANSEFSRVPNDTIYGCGIYTLEKL